MKVKQSNQKPKTIRRAKRSRKSEITEWIAINNEIVTTAASINPSKYIKLNNSARYAFLKNLYQQYKICKVYVNFYPIQENGTNPVPMYFKFITDDSEIPSLDSLKETGILVNQRTGVRKWISLKGLQNDFNYWFDTNNSVIPTMKIYYLPIINENPGKKYMLRISVLVKFRLPMIPSSEVIEKFKEINREEEDKKYIPSEVEKLEERIKELEIKLDLAINKRK